MRKFASLFKSKRCVVVGKEEEEKEELLSVLADSLKSKVVLLKRNDQVILRKIVREQHTGLNKEYKTTKARAELFPHHVPAPLTFEHNHIDYLYIPNTPDLFEKKMSVEDGLDLAIELTSFFTHLHDHSLVHLDIKAENILYNKQEKRFYVIDWENSVESTCVMNNDSVFGTPQTNPPEYYYNKKDLKKIDVWQMGVLAYELLTENKGVPCFSNATKMRAYDWNAKYLDPELRFIFESCFVKTEKRCTMRELEENLRLAKKKKEEEE